MFALSREQAVRIENPEFGGEEENDFDFPALSLIR